MSRVIVVGSLNVDRPWRVERHPQVGETVLAEMLVPVPGGKGLNQAVAARRMGARTRLVGCVGADEDGRWLARVAEDEGIDVGAISVAAGQATGTALIVVAADGANTVSVAPGANAALVVDEDVDVRAGDVVVAQLEVPVDSIAAAFARARAVGGRSILNPSPIGAGAALVPDADIVVVNQHEAAELGGGAVAVTADDAIVAARAIAGAGQTVIVTLGADGAVAHGPEGTVTVAGIPVDPVDTVGAGDCFLGTLAAGLAAGMALADAMERANRAAAIAVTRPGAVDAMPTVADLV